RVSGAQLNRPCRLIQTDPAAFDVECNGALNRSQTDRMATVFEADLSLDLVEFDCAPRIFDRHTSDVAADFGAFAAADDMVALQAGELHGAERVVDFDARRQILWQGDDDRYSEILLGAIRSNGELITRAVRRDLQTDVLRDFSGVFLV